MIYEHDTGTPPGGSVYCICDKHRGLLRDFADKAVWHVYGTLQGALDDGNAYKEFAYTPDCECFEEEVTERWFDTGESL